MQGNEYLPIGHHVGGHYEIMRVLGRDAFEIVYLARDIHRLDYVILKELFLEGSSFRTQEGVYTQEKAKSRFEEIKSGLIREATLLKEAENANSVKTYGYVEANNTLYTIMEFINDANISRYLQIIPNTAPKEPEPSAPPPKSESKKEESTPLPTPEPKPKPKKSYFFIKVLVPLLILLGGLGFYAHKIINEKSSKTKENNVTTVVVKRPMILDHPPLTDRVASQKMPDMSLDTSENTQEERNVPTPTPTPKKIPTEIVKSTPPPVAPPHELETIAQEDEIAEFEIVDEEEEATVTTPAITQATPPPVHTIPTPTAYPTPKKDSNSMLGSYIGSGDNRPTQPAALQPVTFSQEAVRNFLTGFVAATEGDSMETILSYYDERVSRYFSLRNVTHNEIYRDKQQYNRKWRYRKFRLVNFKILRTYTQNGIEYCEINKQTRWQVSAANQQRASGVSNVFLTIKKSGAGFKVTSIYSPTL